MRPLNDEYYRSIKRREALKEKKRRNLKPCALLFHFNEQKFDAISTYLACVYDRFVFIPSY
jgi:hypothetical protein